jgi:hypothetical protein
LQDEVFVALDSEGFDTIDEPEWGANTNYCRCNGDGSCEWTGSVGEAREAYEKWYCHEPEQPCLDDGEYHGNDPEKMEKYNV